MLFVRDAGTKNGLSQGSTEASTAAEHENQFLLAHYKQAVQRDQTLEQKV